MTDKANGTPPAKPRIVIEFAGPGLADCAIEPSPDVTPGQLYGAAYLLDLGAHEVRTRQLMGAAGGLTGATPDLAELLGRLMGGPPGSGPHGGHG